MEDLRGTVDLRARGDKTILVKKEDALFDTKQEKNFSQVLVMHESFEKYREVFADDLEARLDIAADKLPVSLAVTTLLNPIFGLESRIVGSGLMTQTQYTWVRKSVIGLLHDILDKNTPVVVDSGGDDSSDDDVVEPAFNANYNRASDEFIAFEKLKKKVLASIDEEDWSKFSQRSIQ